MAKSSSKTLSQPLAYMRSAVAPIGDACVLRDGGSKGAGLIVGASAISRGEALGHGVWIDRTFVKSVAAAMRESAHKSRFAHPGLSSDGIGRLLGRATDGDLSPDGNKALFDLHISPSAHKTPDGDLAEYAMDLAEQDSGACGFSIVFEHDREAQDAFSDEHTVIVDGAAKFVSPDPLNTKHLPHARLSRLHAVDLVDDPAANPEGMFYRPSQVLDDAEHLAAFCLGLSSEAPQLSQLSMAPDRAKAFVRRFLDRHNLELVPKGTDMKPETVVEDNVQPQEEPQENQQEQPVVAAEESVSDAHESNAQLSRAEQAKPFLEILGDDFGSRCFAAGLELDEAKTQFIAFLQDENDELRKQLDALRSSGAEHVTHRPSTVGQGNGKVSVIRIAGRG